MLNVLFFFKHNRNSGSITYAVMVSLGEMVSYLPIPGGHIKLAERFVNPAFSFVMGWNYWYNWYVFSLICGRPLPAILRCTAAVRPQCDKVFILSLVYVNSRLSP